MLNKHIISESDCHQAFKYSRFRIHLHIRDSEYSMKEFCASGKCHLHRQNLVYTLRPKRRGVGHSVKTTYLRSWTRSYQTQVKLVKA